MRDSYIEAMAYAGDTCILSRVSNMFSREPDTDYGLGTYYIIDVVGTGGARLVSIVCENHDIPVCDFRSEEPVTIRDTVEYMLDNSPPRCAIVLDIRDNIPMQKVRARIQRKHCDLRYKRVIFCLTDQEPTSGNCIRVPGTSEDKMVMLLYHIPERIRNQAESPDCFRPLADAMVDYTLFEPRIWREVSVDGTLDEFLSTAMYQVVRRVRDDPGVDDYPSFELEWRSLLATRLKQSLTVPPDALCPNIHRVIPVGVSSEDAMQAMEVAIPKDIQDPYAVTVQTSAVDDRCGSIAITQPTRYTVVNVNCVINPRLLVDVCRELRVGHRAVVNELHTMSKKMSMERSTDRSIMDEKHEDMNRKLSMIQNEMSTLVKRLTNQDTENDIGRYVGEIPKQCARYGCPRVVTKRFRSGKLHRQCQNCRSHNNSIK